MSRHLRCSDVQSKKVMSCPQAKAGLYYYSPVGVRQQDVTFLEMKEILKQELILTTMGHHQKCPMVVKLAT